MAQLASPPYSNLLERKAQGRAHLEANRVEEALRVYARILRDYPDDVDAYLFLGDCYLADGDTGTALLLYSQAQERAPENREVRRRIGLARAEGSGQVGPIPISAGTAAELLQRLSGQDEPVTEAEVLRATSLLREIIHSPHPAQAVAEHLDEIDALLPALLELNIRQACLDGRPDLAQALQNLLENIRLQMGVRPEESSSAAEKAPACSRLPSELRILFIQPEAQEATSQLSLVAEALSQLGCQTAVDTLLPFDRVDSYDLVVAHRPHTCSSIMEGLAACAAARVPVILDLDIDFEGLPLDHPEYETAGLGTPARARAYAAARLLADVIRVPTESFAASLRSSGCPVQVIPEGWTRRNDLWEKPSGLRHTLNLGWVASPGRLQDLFLVRRILIRVLREFPQLRLVIGGDPQAYQLFDTIPEARRLFLPAVSPEDYPYLLGHIDVLLAPLRNIPFNQSLSDRCLVEAGVRGIPWVASPMPAFAGWGAGGLIANTTEEWHTYLRQMVMDAGLRYTLGQAGRRRAESREMHLLAHNWLSLMDRTLAGKGDSKRTKAA